MTQIIKESEGVEYVIDTICYMHDLVCWKILYIWRKSILGNFKAALYSCIFPDNLDRNGCWRTNVYCISTVDHWWNHCTYII